MPQLYELKPKKWPKQARSKATFDALIDGCTLVLPKLGYAGTTTNHIADAAGVGIASLYEYFPSKDAIIALAVERMNHRILAKLAQTAIALKDVSKEAMMHSWLTGIYDCLCQERDIIRVVLLEVPYSEQVAQQQGFNQQLIYFSEMLEQGASDVLPKKQSKASMYLIVRLVVSSLTQLVINPPKAVEAEDVIQELSGKLNTWVFG